MRDVREIVYQSADSTAGEKFRAASRQTARLLGRGYWLAQALVLTACAAGSIGGVPGPSGGSTATGAGSGSSANGGGTGGNAGGASSGTAGMSGASANGVGAGGGSA